ncbi:MAG: ATP-binding protein [Sneathiella sp.]
MAYDLASLETQTNPRPPRILVYGVPGVGKTVLGITAPKPVFIRTEDGLDGKMPDGTLAIDALQANNGATFPLCKTFEEVLECLATLANEEHDFETLVVDSCDWLEMLLQSYTARKSGHASIEDAGYGKGYIDAKRHFEELYLGGINYLNVEKSMTIMQVAHSSVVKFDSPDVDPYNRYEIKMHKHTSNLLQEHSDCILFANYKIATTKTDVGFNKKQNRAVGTGERILQTNDRPTHLAKNRYGMPDQIPMEWTAIAENIPFFNKHKESQ